MTVPIIKNAMYSILKSLRVWIVGCVPIMDMLPPPLRSGENFMKGAECAEQNGKIIKKFSDFYFSSYHRKLGWYFHKNDTKMTITRKIKIGENWNLVFLSIQVIANLSSKFQKWIFFLLWTKYYYFIEIGRKEKN